MAKTKIIDTKPIVVLILIVLGAGFYWFQIRPSIARQECQKWAYDQGIEYFNYKFLENETPLRKSQLQDEYMRSTYERCMHKKGVE